jgi:hypothetical protein
MGKPGKDGVHGEGAGGAHSVDGEQVLPSLKGLTFHSSNSYDQPGNSECVCVRERTRDGRPASRAHTASAARGRDREDRRRGVCVPRRRPCPGADRARAHARRGRSAHMHVAGRLRPCAPVWNRGTEAPGAGSTTPPAKAAHPLAAGVHEGVAPAPAAARGGAGAWLMHPHSRWSRRCPQSKLILF